MVTGGTVGDRTAHRPPAQRHVLRITRQLAHRLARGRQARVELVAPEDDIRTFHLHQHAEAGYVEAVSNATLLALRDG
ncbi:MAG: hypothetical protein U1F35_14785 [Steroidobacteraceae bacterium]